MLSGHVKFFQAKPERNNPTNSEARRRAARSGSLPRLHDGDDLYALTPTILSNVRKSKPSRLTGLTIVASTAIWAPSGSRSLRSSGTRYSASGTAVSGLERVAVKAQPFCAKSWFYQQARTKWEKGAYCRMQPMTTPFKDHGLGL